MRVFVTGASGWIGSATVDELLAAGHEVTGLARSDASAAALEAKGVRVRRGDLDDLDSIRAGAEDAEAVIHLANKHDWSNPAASAAAERAAVADHRRRRWSAPTGPSCSPPAWPASPRAGRAPRPTHHRSTARTHRAAAARTSRSSSSTAASAAVSLRFSPTVHGAGDHGFIAAIAAVAREKGVSGYPGDGANRWAAVHVSDAARLVALGLAKAPAGSRLHAVAEEGVPTREIAEAIGRAFGLPVASIAPDDVPGHFGWIGTFFGMDLAASSAVTRELLGWTPVGPTLIEDIDAGGYAPGASLAR